MNIYNYEALKKMLSDLQEEYQDVRKKLEKNMIYHQEMDLLLKSLTDADDNEFKSFVPRNAEVIHKEKIEQIKSVLNSYEKENEYLNSLSENLSFRINNIEMILDSEKECLLKLFNIQEEERYRISRDLHDTSLQNLAHLIHKIELSSMYIDQDPLRAKLELSVISKNLKLIIEEIRNTIFNLRPMEFDDLGLKASFERLVCIINKYKDYEIDFSIEDVSCENNYILLNIYRAVQECLTNIKKHAEATKIIFHGKCIEGIYIIRIEDNGKGFTEKEVEEKKNSHFGLSLVKERVHILKGEINISSSNNGTKIEIKIPIEDDFVIR